MRKNKLYNKIFILLLLSFILISNNKTYSTNTGNLKNFKVPLYTKEMQDKGFIKGDAANFIDQNTIIIKNACAEFVPPKMNKRWKFTANNCAFYKNKNIIRSNDFVQFETPGIVIDGKGLIWELNEDKLLIEKNVTVDFEKSVFKVGGNNEKK